MTEHTDKPRTVIIAQARMGSTRLPGKVMMDICGKPMVDHVVERARSSRLADDVVVAIPDLAEDDALTEHLVDIGVRVVRGSADDVLARYAQAAADTQAEVIVRITCDCPLIDPEVIDRVIATFRDGGADYCSNTIERSYPIGMDTEVFSRDALERAHREAVRPDEREHVTPYIWRQTREFRTDAVEAPSSVRYPEMRLTVDEKPDIDLVRDICSRLGREAPLTDIVGLLLSDEVLRTSNASVRHRHLRR